MDLTTRNLAKDMMSKLHNVYGMTNDINTQMVTHLLATVIEQEKKIRTLEAQYESLAYRFLDEREQRRSN